MKRGKTEMQEERGERLSEKRFEQLHLGPPYRLATSTLRISSSP